jgi:hypothetical protein
MVDRIITSAQPPTDGVYTSGGEYEPGEFFGLVLALSDEMGHPASTFLRSFGRHMFRTVLERNPRLLKDEDSALSIFSKANEIIRASRIFSRREETPNVAFQSVGPWAWQLIVRSSLPIEDLAEGVVEACIAHFDEPLNLQRSDFLHTSNTAVRFDITITDGAKSCLMTYR